MPFEANNDIYDWEVFGLPWQVANTGCCRAMYDISFGSEQKLKTRRNTRGKSGQAQQLLKGHGLEV